jgi:tetratricopeptide (TPR) repeat protein
MRYLCVNCDEKFELAESAELRCPKCMRVHGLRKLEAAPESVEKQPKTFRGGAVVFVMLLFGLCVTGAFLLWKRAERPDAATLVSMPLEPRQLQRELERASVQVGALSSLLEADAAVASFARQAVAGRSGAEDKARAIVKALRARAASGGFVAWSLADPRVGPVMTAAQTLAAISKEHAQKELYPLEVAALAVAALRAVDVPGMLAEVYAWPGERSPLDPSGRFGYFGVALPRPTGKPRVLDPYAGRSEQEQCTECALLSDVQALGAGLALMASQRLAANEDPAAALRDADAAVKLAASSPSVRTARGAVLLANGASDLGQGELEAAAQMRPDSARRNNLAMLYMAQGDGERAAREVAQLLEQEPDFALGHITLAEIHLARGERELSRAELEKAEGLDPRLPSLPLTWAQFYASAGENERAIEHGRRAVKARPSDPQAHLVLARIYRQAALYDEMRVEARAVLALTPQALGARTHELLERLLGPTALESPPEAGSGSAPAAQNQALPDPDHLDLSKPGGSSPSRLRLMDDPTGPPSGGTLKGGGSPPTLKLNEPGTGLKLGSQP